MCRQIYTQHLCGHKSVQSEQCNSTLTSTGVLFCEQYHSIRTFSPQLCAIGYCREDKECAYWVENGPDQLSANDDEISDTKRCLQICQRELRVVNWYKSQWGELQREREGQRAQKVRESTKELLQKLEDAKERRRFVIGEMSAAKEKLDKAAQSLVSYVHEYMSTHVPAEQSPVALHSSINSEGDLGRDFQQTTQSMSPSYPSSFPSQPPVLPYLENNGGVYVDVVKPPFNRRSGFTSDPFRLLQSFKNSREQVGSLQDVHHTTPRPAKKRGRPVKTPAATNASVTPASRSGGKRRSGKRAQLAAEARAEAEAQRLLSSETRRSRRLSGKKKISYAESSTSPSPAPPSPSVTKRVVAQKPSASRPTRTRKSSRKVLEDEDDAFEEDGGGDTDIDDGDDGDWKDPEADVAASQFRNTTRSGNKRKSNAPQRGPRKQHAGMTPVAPRFSDEPESYAHFTSSHHLKPSPAHAQWMNQQSPGAWPSTDTSKIRTSDVLHTNRFPELQGDQNSFYRSGAEESTQNTYAPAMSSSMPLMSNPLAGDVTIGTEVAWGGDVRDGTVGAGDPLQHFSAVSGLSIDELTQGLDDFL